MERDCYEAFDEASITTDAILAEGELVEAGRFGEPVAGPDGRSGVAFGLDPRTCVTVDLHGADWTDWDDLVLPVHVPPGADAVLSVSMACGTRTAGLHTDDTFHIWSSLGRHARYARHGWIDAELPYEVFHIVGRPDGWRRLESLTVTLAGAGEPILVGALRGRRRDRRPGPRLTADGLFEELDLDRPDLAAVRAALDRGRREEAETALLDHFRTRTAPEHVFPRVQPPADRAGLRRTADRLRRHVILDQTLAPEIDWRVNPNGYLEWRHAFNRHGWMRPLLTACLTADDPASARPYAAELDSLISTWIAQSPCPVGHAGGGDPAWETLSTAVRIYGIWLDLWCGLQESGAFTAATRLAMLRSIWAHAEHLMEHSVIRHNNWEIVESEAISLIGLMFPEFRRAADWRREGLARLWGELKRQVHEDGVQWELSPGYHMMSGQGFVLPYQLMVLNETPVPPEAEARLRLMFEAIMHLTRPDGTLPSLNDSGDVAGSGRAWLRTGAELFGRQDWLRVARQGEDGAAPTAGSHALDHAGLYVMRSGWAADDRWLVFDGAPLGHAHQHEDKLSFELYAHGTTFIVDPGIAGYMRDPWTDFSRSGWAHNTIAVDGQPQNRRSRESRDRNCRSVAGENLWAAGDVLDVVGSTYDGPYGDAEPGCVHRRWIVFVKPDYWLVFDDVAGQGWHRVESLLHFAPMRLRVGEGEEVVCTDRLGHPNLDVLRWPQGGRWAVRIVTGRHDPVQGWITGAGRLIVPAPTAVLAQRRNLPIRCGLIFAPYASGTTSGIHVDRRQAPRGRWAATIRLPDGRSDHVHVAWEPDGEVRGRGVRTDGRIAVVRCGPDGAAAAAAVVEGARLSLARRKLIDRPQSADLAEWRDEAGAG